MVFLSFGPALLRIEAEKANPQADVWFGAPSENHILAKERGLTEPYVSQNAAALSDEFKDKEGYWHAIYTNPLAIGVRTDILESRKAPVPASWEDLKNPAYKGLIQMPSPQSSGTAYALILTLIDERGEDGAFEYLSDQSQRPDLHAERHCALRRARRRRDAAGDPVHARLPEARRRGLSGAGGVSQ